MPDNPPPPSREDPVRRHGLARVLSKMGIASRTEAARWIASGQVTVNGRVQRDPEHPVMQGRDRIEVKGRDAVGEARVHLMLNKPRGLVTTTRDDRGRDTVYRCLEDHPLPWLMPVGRLDKASEGLLLFCNDPEWAARISAPEAGLDKTYHVQIDRIPEPSLLGQLVSGIDCEGEQLCAKSASLLRRGEKNAWLEIILDEGRNRQIRRLLASHGIEVLRLLRVAIGPLRLGDLAKGKWRMLSADEIGDLAPSDRTSEDPG